MVAISWREHKGGLVPGQSPAVALASKQGGTCINRRAEEEQSRSVECKHSSPSQGCHGARLGQANALRRARPLVLVWQSEKMLVFQLFPLSSSPPLSCDELVDRLQASSSLRWHIGSFMSPRLLLCPSAADKPVQFFHTINLQGEWRGEGFCRRTVEISKVTFSQPLIYFPLYCCQCFKWYFASLQRRLLTNTKLNQKAAEVLCLICNTTD